MTTVSPQQYSSYANSRIQHTTAASFPRSFPSRPALRKRPQIDSLSQSHGFSADAPMLQKISYDSSDDEIPQPMNFSALTKAILEDKPSARERTPPPEPAVSHTRYGSDSRNAGRIESSRGGTPSGRRLRITRKSPSPEVERERISTPHDGQRSNSRSEAAAGPRRSASVADIRLVEENKSEKDNNDYVTPAPVPHRRPRMRSRANSTTSGAGTSATSSQPRSLGSRTGQISESHVDSAEELAHGEAVERARDDASDSAERARSRGAAEGMPGSMRLKRVPLGSGTFLRGAPLRRPLRKRQDEDDDSPKYDSQAEFHEEVGRSILEEKEPQGPETSKSEGKQPNELIERQDFASVKDRSNSPITHARPPSRNQAINSKENDPASSHKRHPSSGQIYSTAKSGDAKTDDDMKNKQFFRMPAPPLLPSSHDQENEPPPTFKRNKPQIGGVMDSFDKISILKEPKQSKMLVDTPATKSPQRQALAPKSVNTPQRQAPPPPKMSVLETATANGGASTVKSKKKRSHITINGKIFSLRGRLGKGGSSDVYRVMAENDKMFALKKVNLEDCNEDTVRGYKGEIELLKKLENVDRVVRLFDWEVNEQKQSLSVLMEIGESDLNRILSGRLHPENAELDLSFTRHYWREILNCVAAVHEHDIVHSDLKPANFLLVQGRLKLIDFGIANAIDVDNTVNVHRETNVGTPNYMSPESLQDTNADKTTSQGAVAKLMKLGKPSDVWSLGCILYQMTYGKPPFAHIANQWNRVMAIINPNVTISYPNAGVGGITVPESLKRLLQSCLNRDPSQRPTIAQMLDRREPFLNPDSQLDKWEADKCVPMSEQLLEQILNKIVERCRDPKRGCPNQEEMKVYPRAFLDKVRSMQRL